MEPIRIPANKNSLILNTVTLVFLYFMFFVTTMPPILVGMLCVSLAVLSGSNMSNWYRVSTKPALLADNEGVTDATGTVPGGLVYWHEIAAIETIVTPAEKLLLLRLHDSETYLSRLPTMTRTLLAGSVSTYGTPCVVAQSDIGVPVEHAAQELTDARLAFAGVPVPVAASVPDTVPTAPAAHWWTAVPPEERAAKPTQIVGRSGDR